ncbi:MAG: ATP-binding protein, partial [Elusimicrobiota bacterium]
MPARSLAVRILVWILPSTLAVISIISVFTYLIARQAIVRELSEGIQSFSNISALQAGSFFEQRYNDLATISQSPLFRDHNTTAQYGLTEEAEVYRREIEKMLLDFSIRMEVYPHMGYIDSAGREVCVIRNNRIAGPKDALVTAEDSRALRGLRRGERLVSGIHKTSWHDAPLLRYSVGIFDEKGAWRGALVFDSSLAPIYRSLGRLNIGRSGRSYLTMRRGQHYDRFAPPRLANDLVTAWAAVPGTPWEILTAVSRAEFLGSLRRIATATFLLCLVASILLILIITRQVRALLAPLGLLVETARSYAQGKLDRRVKIDNPAEIATLAGAFNTMADSLERRTDDLERRVRELSALQRMNEFILFNRGRREIGRACLEAAVKGLGFDRGQLFWIDPDSREVVGECSFHTDCSGLEDEAISGQRLHMDSDDILALVARTRQAVNVTDAAHDPRCRNEALRAMWASDFCLAPLTGRNRVLGLIYVDRQRSAKPISEQELRSLNLFCSEAGLALENTQLWDAVVQSEARYRTAVENSPYAVVGLDQNLRITLWNRRAEALFGYQPTEVYGRSLNFLFADPDYRKMVREIETSGSVRQAEILGATRDKRQLELNISWSGQSAAPGAAREWFVVMQDETEKKRLHAQLLQVEKLSAVGKLIAGVAHELNNPLAAVTGFAELMADIPIKQEQRDDLRLLHSSALRCRDIVRGLLLFVRQGKPVRERVALNRAVQEAVALMEYRIVKTEGIKLEVDLDSNAPQVAGEFQKLQQVFVNLVNNACDAMRNRLGPRVIRVRTRQLEGGAALAEVEDTGPGVPEDIRTRIFEPFFTTKPAGTGTGLGLSISGQIIAEFGAILNYGSSP